MKKRVVVLLLLIASLMSIIVVSAQESVESALNKEDTVEVFVKFKDMQRARTRSFVANSMDEFNFSYRARSFNGATINVTREEYQRLINRADIDSVRVTPEFKLGLTDSLGLVNSSAAKGLQINGVNLTGRGQSICIIDSGIDYTHPSLGGCTKASFLSGSCSKVLGGYAFYNPVNSSNLNDIMDNQGHGTHVSGIAAGQTTTIGVAPDATLIGMKACDSSSSCNLAAIVDSINWCVGNASTYNITVISMSLGTSDLFNSQSECDAFVPDLTTAIAAAIRKNISVVASTGNNNSGNGNPTHIGNPGCISNVTSVSATHKNGSLDARYAHRGILTKLLAPGTSIISTALGGGTETRTGTSMAAPHVSGAIALIRQYLTSANLTRTPQTVETALNSSGTPVRDPVTSAIYSSINAYGAILAIDATAPNVSLTNPTNNSNLTSSAQTFNASFSDWQLKNATLLIWNSSNSLIHSQNVNVSGISNFTNLTVSNLTLGSYQWTFNVSDVRGNMGNSSLRSFSIPALITINNPDDNYNLVSDSTPITFNFSLSSNSNISNCSLIINSAIRQTADVINISLPQTFIATITPGSYAWQISCTETNNATYITPARSIVMTSNQPQVSSSSSGGGGGGGGGPTTFRPTQTSTTTGYTQTLTSKENIQFTIFDTKAERHTLSVNAVTDEYVNITIRSDPINLTLGVGQSVKINLSSAEFYDLYVKVEKIEKRKATLTIQTIHEALPVPKTSKIQANIIQNSTAEENKTEIVDTTSSEVSASRLQISTFDYILIGITIMIALIVFCVDRQRKDKLP